MDNEREPSVNENPDNSEAKEILAAEDNRADSTADEIESAKENEEGQSVHEENQAKGSKFTAALSVLYDYVEVFAVSIIAVILIFTFCVRLCKVDGNSMNNTLKNEELIIATNLFYEPKQGDIIVFHLVNHKYQQPLVKRVIATEGQTVEINMQTGVIKVDGEIYEDTHAYLSGGKYETRADFDSRYYSSTTESFAATVPQGTVFVLGDNRNNSNDSRMRDVGFVDVDTILGKAVLRLAPFTFLE